jgi:hypothetical protein
VNWICGQRSHTEQGEQEIAQTRIKTRSKDYASHMINMAVLHFSNRTAWTPQSWGLMTARWSQKCYNKCLFKNRKPSRYGNICKGVLTVFFMKLLLHKGRGNGDRIYNCDVAVHMVCIWLSNYNKTKIWLTGSNIQVDVFWVVTPCSVVVGHRFEGQCCLHLRGEVVGAQIQEGSIRGGSVPSGPIGRGEDGSLPRAAWGYQREDA